MISDGDTECPRCGGQLRYYDSVLRVLRTKNRVTSWITIRRVQCDICKAVHRELPESIFPYKQYEAEIISGVIEGLITSETLGYEDYPCEMTMIRWKRA